MALARRGILEISYRTDLSHSWWGRVLLAGARNGLWGNIAVAVSIASPSMVGRSLAMPRLEAIVSYVGSPLSSRGWYPDARDMESSREKAIGFASKK